MIVIDLEVLTANSSSPYPFVCRTTIHLFT